MTAYSGLCKRGEREREEGREGNHMQRGSAFTITKLLRELTTRDRAIKPVEHETKSRGRERRKRDFTTFRSQL